MQQNNSPASSPAQTPVNSPATTPTTTPTGSPVRPAKRACPVLHAGASRPPSAPIASASQPNPRSAATDKQNRAPADLQKALFATLKKAGITPTPNAGMGTTVTFNESNHQLFFDYWKQRGEAKFKLTKAEYTPLLACWYETQLVTLYNDFQRTWEKLDYKPLNLTTMTPEEKLGFDVLCTEFQLDEDIMAAAPTSTLPAQTTQACGPSSP